MLKYREEKVLKTKNKEFLLREYRKALHKGYFHYAWVILQNLQKKARYEKFKIEFSNLYVSEEGFIFSV